MSCCLSGPSKTSASPCAAALAGPRDNRKQAFSGHLPALAARLPGPGLRVLQHYNHDSRILHLRAQIASTVCWPLRLGASKMSLYRGIALQAPLGGLALTQAGLLPLQDGLVLPQLKSQTIPSFASPQELADALEQQISQLDADSLRPSYFCGRSSLVGLLARLCQPWRRGGATQVEEQA
ncbi:MAG: hypothetical protein EOO40_08285 [Deltaproteobacteria bacterium]|nr:MAG: hypothetical protein EOO40_08285 [Deltaproteobacteria bacterium]